MTWLADETGVESSAPREGIEIRHGSTVYRIATGSRDIVINGNRFEALAAERSEIEVSTATNAAELEIRLPVSHAFPQRWLGAASPPHSVRVIVWRQQSSETEAVWRGVLTTCTVRDHVAMLRGVASTAPALRRSLPTIRTGRTCSHILFDGNCKVARSSFRVSTTVANFNGRGVNVASIGGNPDQWAQGGELLHLPSGERMTISSQVGTAIVMQFPIAEMQDGDAVHVFAGCNRTMTVCAEKFANQANFGGSPQAPTENPMIPGKNLGLLRPQ